MTDSSSRASPEPRSANPGFLPDGEARRRLRRWRGIKDGLARYGVGTFGIGVVIALALIFVYLFSEVFPMLRGASMEVVAEYPAPGGEEMETVHTAMDRHRTMGVRYTADRRAVFFTPADGEVHSVRELPLPDDARVSAFGRAEPRTRLVVFGLDNGKALLSRHEFNERFDSGERVYDPDLEFPSRDEQSGEALLDVVQDGTTIREIAVQRGSEGISVAAALEDGRIRLVRFEETTSFMTGEVSVERKAWDLDILPDDARATRLLLDITMSNMLVGDDQGRLHYYDVRRPDQARLEDSSRVIRAEEAQVTALEYILGTVSFIVGGSDGTVAQYMLVRDDDNINRIRRIREFDGHDSPVTQITPEYIRKGFATSDETGQGKIHYSTSHRTLAEADIAGQPLRSLVMAPRANGMFAVDQSEQFHVLNVNNPHPEVSLGALWSKVWYEGRSGPDYVWQSSSATDEFEPKFSLIPLTVGTLKAAFYAMLFAMPLAILGAMYSAYFMAPKLRQMVKPSIEVMEALPTVILGFLAGLWFAPFLEKHIPAAFTIVLLMPLGILLFALFWQRLVPENLRAKVADGWEAALLVPMVFLVGWLCVVTSPWIEIILFNGDMRQWLTDIGITYDQRNALVIGVAMGFAVIPTIYSISEDAIFNVPKHLTQGSLALGATSWQTMTRVVLLTASPGIFSAVMIGFGRAVGETMIVLMATGNSPVVNFNIFEGMRTLSANIAVEMPEAAVGGTHYRILFLAALVLFVMTFVLNTFAEVVRQRLRRRYSTL